MLRDISFSVRRGEFVSIIGPSGCGKTTLLRLIAGLDCATGGEIRLEGKTIDGPSPERGFVFQQGALFPWLTAEENIACGLKARGVLAEHKQRVSELLCMMGLEGFEKSWPHQLSGGMAQRVAIARSLIMNPAVLLMDEPMGALDSFTRGRLQDNLLDVKRHTGSTMILVTHDIDEAIYLSDRIIVMSPRPGRIREILNVPLPFPRDRAGSEFLAFRGSLLHSFREHSSA